MASSVRAKAALFGTLSAGAAGNGGSNRGGNRTVGQDTSPAIRLPPTSSAPSSDLSISHPITAPFMPKSTLKSTTAAANPKVAPLPRISPPSRVGGIKNDTANGSSNATGTDYPRRPVLTAIQPQPSTTSAAPQPVRKDAYARGGQDRAGEKLEDGPFSDAASDASSQPPLPPLKPFPPKLSAAAPGTPFDVRFPSGSGILDAAGLVAEQQLSSSTSQPSALASRSSRTSGLNKSSSPTTTRAAALPMRDRSGSVYKHRAKTSDEADPRSRESVYSIASSLGGVGGAVVSTANAVQIQRIAQQPRTMHPSPSSLTKSSEASRAPRAPSVDKGIGVKMRRKSRESASSDRRRPKSSGGNRSSGTGSSSLAIRHGGGTDLASESVMPTLDSRESLAASEETKPEADRIGASRDTVSVITPSIVRSSPDMQQEGLYSGTASAKPTSSQATTSSSVASSLRKGPRLAPLQINPMNGTTPVASSSNRIVTSSPNKRAESNSGSAATSSLRSPAKQPRSFSTESAEISVRSLTGRDGWSTSNASDVLDPLSDTWGRNSSIATYENDDEIASMGALSFSPAASPVDERYKGQGVSSSGVQAKARAPATGIDQGASARDSRAKDGSMYEGGAVSASSSSSRLDMNRSAKGRFAATVALASSINKAKRVADMSGSGAADGGAAASSAKPIDIKDKLLTQLLASMSLVDTQSFETISSLEQVETLKRELARLERRIEDVQHKVKVQMRVRDAADKLRRAGNRSRPGFVGHAATPSMTGIGNEPRSAASHKRQLSIASSVGNADLQQAESDVATATQRVDQASRDLMKIVSEASTMRRRLLEHHARVLALRVHALEEEGVAKDAHINASEQTNGKDDEMTREATTQLAEELEHMEARVKEVECALEDERKKSSEREATLRKQHDEDRRSLVQKHDEVRTALESKVRELASVHESSLGQERRKHGDLERKVNELQADIHKRTEDHAALAQKMDQLEFETTAERNIMLERQKLFSAFESRLERAEKRLHEQDDRCSRMLGKAEGREEMDDLLNQIKYGTSQATKRDKTAGQDIDGLIDRLTNHIDDMEDEIHRANALRLPEGSDHSADDDVAPHVQGGTSNDSDLLIRELQDELRSTQREAEEKRVEAESAKRQLAALQRQSALSFTSTNGGGNTRGSVLGVSSWGGQSMGGRMRHGSIRSAAELEARVTLLEKRNAVLEAELAHVRDPSIGEPVLSSDESNYTTYDSFKLDSPTSKDAGSSNTSASAANIGPTSRNHKLYAETISNLFRLVPALPADASDLHEIQEELESMPNTEGASVEDNAEDVCRILTERVRNTLFVGRSLVGKALSLEMERVDFDEHIDSMENEKEELKVAVEDLRASHASQLQIIESGKSREEHLQTRINELDLALSDLRKSFNSSVESATSAALAAREERLRDAKSGVGHERPSLASMINNQSSRMSRVSLSSTASRWQDRRNVIPVHSTRLMAPASANVRLNNRSNASTTTGIVPVSKMTALSPSSSKLSFTSSAVQTASTPASSHPAWSPANFDHHLDKDGAPSAQSYPSSQHGTEPEAHQQDNRSEAAARKQLSVKPTPRTMMLGLDVPQLMERVRQLESEVARSSAMTTRNKAGDAEKEQMEQILRTCQSELEENRKEMDEIRNVESRQRIELLEELTSLTAELSDARAHIRQFQRRKPLPAVDRLARPQ